MQEFAIPLIALLVVFFLNLIIKKKFFCISSVVILYWIICVGGAFFIYMNPRTGFSFSDHNAMVFLTQCVVFLMMPLVFAKDHKVEKAMIDRDFLILDSHQNLWWKLVIVLVVAELCFSTNIVEFMRFLRSGLDREAFRLTIDRSVRGNLIATCGALCMLPAKLAIFLSFVYLFFGKEEKQKKLAIWLLVGSFAILFWSLQQIDRRELGKVFFQFLICLLLFLEYIPKEKKRAILIRIGGVTSVLLIPFLAVSIMRYDDWIYQMAQYFSAGPYFFNADYVAVTDYNLPLFYGDYNFPLIANRISGFTGTEPEIKAVNMWTQGAIFHQVYYMISQCHPFEFKTLVGCLILDFPKTAVYCAILIFSCISVLYFRFAQYSLSYLFFLFLYSYTMLFGTIMYPFSYFIFNAELIVLLGYGWYLSSIIRRGRMQIYIMQTNNTSRRF